MSRVLNRSIASLVCCFLGAAAAPLHAELVADFENLSLGISYGGSGGGSYENGKNLSGGFSSGGATFENSYSMIEYEYDGKVTVYETWTGWAYSNTIDTVTPGLENQFSAYAPVGDDDPTTYAVGYFQQSYYLTGQGEVAAKPATIQLPGAPLRIQVTNTTYAALAMIDGDDGRNANFVKKFGGEDGSDPDWFRLTISGKDRDGNPTGSLPPFFLADYQAADDTDDYVIADWTWVDLTGLPANTRTLEFWLSSSDTGLYGINTPTYFAVDNLTTVPEPGMAVLVGVALLSAFVAYRLRSRQ